MVVFRKCILISPPHKPFSITPLYVVHNFDSDLTKCWVSSLQKENRSIPRLVCKIRTKTEKTKI